MQATKQQDTITVAQLARELNERFGYAYNTIRSALTRHNIELQRNTRYAVGFVLRRADVQHLIEEREGWITRAQVAQILGIENRSLDNQSHEIQRLVMRHQLQTKRDPFIAGNYHLYKETEMRRIAENGVARQNSK